MHRNYIVELSKYYKRLMDLEHCFKNKLAALYIKTHGNQSFNRLLPYLIKLEKISGDKYKIKFTQLSRQHITEAEKLDKAIRMLYFTDLVNVLREKLFYKDKVKKVFYITSPDKNTLFTHSSKIKAFRNAVAHYDIIDYINNKKGYLDALNFFDSIVGCKDTKYNIVLPAFSSKPSTQKIIEAINQQNPVILTQDRILCEIFDDIALCNGYSFERLPKYWTIIRRVFDIKAKAKSILSINLTES